MIGADPCSDNCLFSAVLSSCSDSMRKVQPRTGNCISRTSYAALSELASAVQSSFGYL
ncbi:unnamed protein product, partial [Staurois parvus]